MKVYILTDDYDVDSGALVLGVYATREAADAAREQYAIDYNKPVDEFSINDWTVR